MKKKVTIVLVIISIVAISIMIMFSIYKKSSEACRKANAAIHIPMQKFHPKQAC